MTAPASHLLVRRAADEDAESVADVYFSAAWLAPIHSEAEVRRWVADHVIPHLETWVVDIDKRVVAMCSLAPAQPPEQGGWLEQLHVHSDYQGRSIGNRLLRLAKERYSTGLQLWTFQGNVRARTFYERRGFVAVEFTNGARNEEGEPDVRYIWSP